MAATISQKSINRSRSNSYGTLRTSIVPVEILENKKITNSLNSSSGCDHSLPMKELVEFLILD